MLSQELTAIVDATFFYQDYEEQTRTLLQQFVDVQKTRAEIIHFMQQHGLVAFIANDAKLPRHSGVDDRPLTASPLIPFNPQHRYK